MTTGKKLRAVSLYIIALILFSTAFVTLSPYKAHADAEIFFAESSFPSISGYSNAQDGTKIKISMSEEQYNRTNSVKYHLVKINDSADEVTYDADEIYINSKTVGENDIISNGEIVNFTVYENANSYRYAYFEITAYEWCAIVLDVVFDSTKHSYSSFVYKIINIDNSKPYAYYKNWTFESGYYIFNVIVNDNQPKAVRTASSGLKKVEILKETNGAAQVIYSEDVTIQGIYSYKLKTDSNKAKYFVRATDYAGNQGSTLILEFLSASYNADFESAAKNSIDELKLYKDYYTPSLLDRLEDGFAAYYLYVQQYDSADESAKVTTKTRVESQISTVTSIMGEYAKAKEFFGKGVKDFSLEIINPEYIEGVKISNAEKAYASLLYGEKALFTLILAEFDLSKVDKSEEISFSKIRNADRVINITLNTKNSVEGEINKNFEEPLFIKAPIKNYGKAECILKIDNGDGSYSFKKLEFDEYNNYILIKMPQSYGVITIITGKNRNAYLWFFTLLLIPIGVAVFFTVKNIKVKKSEKIASDIEKDGNVKEIIYNPKNKSKKKSKKKNKSANKQNQEKKAKK